MKISVAMCTFNGAAYLAEQLASIAAQDGPPDELVICDDGSTDATAELVRRFAAAAPLEVRLAINPRQLGSRANFARSIALCRGDWIVLADQDDVWMPHKLRRLREAIGRDPEPGLVFTDAAIVDQKRRPLGYSLWEAIRFTAGQQRRGRAGRLFEVLLQHNVVSGAAMAFAARYRDLVLPIPEGWVHDGWIALVIAAVAPCRALAEPLIEYRQHAAQQIGEKKRSLYEQYLRGRGKTAAEFQAVADNYAVAAARLRGQAGRQAQTALAALERKAAHFQAKARMRRPAAWRLPLILRELLRGHYRRFSSGWRSLAQDLFL
jgi:hypothetical protein